MKFKKIHLIIIIIIFAIFIAYNFSNATSFTGGVGDTKSAVTALGSASDDPTFYMANIVKAGLTLIGIIFIALLIYGGFVYLTAAGSDDKVKKGKTAITRAVVGLIIILAGYSITLFITQQIESPGSGIATPITDECWDSIDQNFNSVLCCEERFAADALVDFPCCSQTPFSDAHPTECADYISN